jgi:hypothetical protein
MRAVRARDIDKRLSAVTAVRRNYLDGYGTRPRRIAVEL